MSGNVLKVYLNWFVTSNFRELLKRSVNRKCCEKTVLLESTELMRLPHDRSSEGVKISKMAQSSIVKDSQFSVAGPESPEVSTCAHVQ